MAKDTFDQVVIYQSSDGKLQLEAQLQGETIWLTQAQIAELFGKGRSTITEHIQNIYPSKTRPLWGRSCSDFSGLNSGACSRVFDNEGELQASETTKKISNVGKTDITTFKPPTYYNLDVIISVGYRVNSAIATRFRQWATQTLKEYIIKGFVMDDERLENNERIQKAGYFDDLLERVRKIRLSEKLFYEKVKLIFSETSYDYDPKSDAAKVAKNYLDENELRQLFLISEQFLSFAELQIQRKRMLYMRDWAEKLDDMLRRNDFEVLMDKGKVSHKAMEERVKAEMAKYRQLAIESDETS